MQNPSTHRYDPAWHTAEPEPPSADNFVFDRRAVREVDRIAIEEYGIPGLVLMENAALGLAREAMRMLTHLSASSHRHPCAVLIVCGSGNNGGDGYALARHLHNRDVEVTLAAIDIPRPNTDAAANRAICLRMGITDLPIDELEHWADSHSIDLIVDAIFGTGLDRSVGPGKYADTINWINRRNQPVLAIDIPSGMDCDTGRPLGCCVQATRTVTFVGVKSGFIELDAQKLLGEVTVVDIGAPAELKRRFGRKTAAHKEPPEHLELETVHAAPPAR